MLFQVKNLIERCICLYMTRDEAVNKLVEKENLHAQSIILGKRLHSVCSLSCICPVVSYKLKQKKYKHCIQLICLGCLTHTYESVWQKLEEENEEFFKAYYLRIKLKKQILKFNQLLEKQCCLMNKKAYLDNMNKKASLYNVPCHMPGKVYTCKSLIHSYK